MMTDTNGCRRALAAGVARCRRLIWQNQCRDEQTVRDGEHDYEHLEGRIDATNGPSREETGRTLEPDTAGYEHQESRHDEGKRRAAALMGDGMAREADQERRCKD